MTTASVRPSRPWWDLAAVLFLILLVSAIYGARLGHQPLVGEETRWATSARAMLATGDWIVPRQQNLPFPERPPMTIWAMAAVGCFRGNVDALAIRLPSVIAVVLTALLIYGYTRACASQFAAFAAALAYATFGQVLQIGRMGESEAMFALGVGASLLLWHLGYLRRWRPLAVWMLGFACAAFAALVKGPQAPIYFVAITALYLIARRDWQFLLRWQYAAGVATFVAILAAWQVPFYLATDLHSVLATWGGLAADRLYLSGLIAHFFTYPLETFACLLPWSPLLLALVKRETRGLLADQAPIVTFIAIAVVVAYPTVWIAAGARGRYFMPLYPLVAVLVGLVVERCSAAANGTYSRRAWHQFVILWAAVIGAGGLVVAAVALGSSGFRDSLGQPRFWCAAIAALAAICVYLLWKCYRSPYPLGRTIAIVVIAAFVGMFHVGPWINANVARWPDPSPAVAAFKRQLPPGAKLVSLSPIDHRFEYFYNAAIPELEWPHAVADLPENVEYFCFMRDPRDIFKRRHSDRGRTLAFTPGTLPFAWEEVTAICVERRIRDRPQPMIVLGRVIRPLQATTSDVTVPQQLTAVHQGSTRKY